MNPLGAYRPHHSAISLFLDIGQGAGLAGATGVRPFLPPLLAGALASGDIGLDFDGTGFAFLEKPGFLAAVFAIAVASYVVERRRPSDVAEARPGGPPGTDAGLGLVAVVLGGLLFAGSLEEGGRDGLPGLVAGAACAALAYVAVTAFLRRVRRRLDDPSFLPVYADALALALAGLAILLPPVGLLALPLFVWLLVAGRRTDERKYEGLRILR